MVLCHAFVMTNTDNMALRQLLNLTEEMESINFHYIYKNKLNQMKKRLELLLHLARKYVTTISFMVFLEVISIGLHRYSSISTMGSSTLTVIGPSLKLVSIW